ncbi:MAG: ATP synthase F1 subunit gamma [Planctomycetota bacterium]
MANARVIVRRRKSVRNIRKITRTMQLIATARFQASLQRAMATKPYSEKLAELVADISRAAKNVSHPLMASHPDVKRSALLIVTSNRGLCGSYNTNVLRLALQSLTDLESRGTPADVYMVGKKGTNYFRFLRKPVHERVTNITDAPRFDQVEPLANTLMGRFERGEIASVEVIYMRFHTMGQQRPHRLSLLPLRSEERKTTPESDQTSRQTEFEFSPAPKELLDELLPAMVRMRLFQCFTDAAACEQIARMVAMKAATDSAGEMITTLTRKYNRARQTQITMELLDIIGGANALA